MFEAVVALCAVLDGTVCRDALVPGYEAATQAGCEARLAEAEHIDNARCVPVGQVLEITEVAPGLFVHVGQIAEPDSDNRGDVSNIGFVIGERSVAVIDSGTAAWMAEALWRVIRAQTDLPVSHVILTHMHPDHVLGASVLSATGARIVGHSALPRALADRQENYLESLERLVGTEAFLGTAPPNVTDVIETSGQIDLGGRSLVLQSWPSAHTGSDLTVFDPATGTLFAGDLIFHQHAPALDGSLRGWQAVLQDLADLDLARVVPGHGGPVLTWPDGANSMRRYLDALARDTKAAIDKGERMGDAIQHIAAGEATHWHLFDAYNPRNATVAYTELEWE